jgi:hypothetical protein
LRRLLFLFFLVIAGFVASSQYIQFDKNSLIKDCLLIY